MQCFLRKFETKRAGYSGWAVMFDNSAGPMSWTTSTTKREVEQLISRHGWKDRARPVRVEIGVFLACGEQPR